MVGRKSSWQRCQLLRMEGKERSIYEKASNETAETAFRAANPHGLSCSVLAAAIQGGWRPPSSDLRSSSSVAGPPTLGG